MGLYCMLHFDQFVFAYRSKIVAMTDERVKLMREVVKGMHAIKLYSWEEPFINLLKDIGRLVKQHFMSNFHFMTYLVNYQLAPEKCLCTDVYVFYISA